MSKSPRANSLMASRLNLIGKIQTALGRMGDQSSPLLLIFWGSRGSGKSTFLKEAERRLSTEADLGIAGHWDVANPKSRDLSKAILKAVGNRKSKYKAVFLDNLDILLKDPSARDFFDFESNTILPLIERGDTLILTGSQVELSQWQEYDVRLREENHQIGPLSPDEIREMVEGRKFDAETVYKLTFGHPKLLEKVQEHPKWTERETARFAYNYFLEEFPNETREIAQMISLFPAFNVYILRKVQGDANTEDDGLLDHYNNQINELTRRWIVHFDTESGAYRFTDNAIRRLLALNFSLSHPKQFNDIQDVAAIYFQEEAKSASFLPQLIVSAIYHQAQASRAQSPNKRGAYCTKWVQSMRDYWNGASWRQVIDRWENGDGDPELKLEILSLIGDKYHKKISEMFSTYKKEMEA